MIPEDQTEQKRPAVMPDKQSMQTIPDDPNATATVEDEIVNEDRVEIGPAQQMQIDAYSDNATIVVFSEQSQPAVLQSLQSGKNPIDSVAITANLIHRRLQDSLEKNGEKMTEITMCLGAAHLVAELIVLADAAKLFTLENEDRLEAYRHTLMRYFEAGLKDGSIDPVELQKTIEPLMTDEQRAYGEEQMVKNGIMKTPPASSAMFRNRQQADRQPRQGGILGGA